MQTTFKQQIEAIQIAMQATKGMLTKDTRQALNDAASTIASLNMTSNLSSEGITASEIKNQFPSNDVIITVEKLYTEE